MGLGRKKSSMALKEATKSNAEAPMARHGSVDSNADRSNSVIFNTSLAAGMPMGPLSREYVRLVIPDLPVLQQLWLTTAEALILDRKIVERASDIRRNAQVMLGLIREEDMSEEDEWWYGQVSHDSIRPPQESMDDDPIEEGP